MTGFGGAKTTADGLSLVSEIKAVNNRYFKLSIKLSDKYSVFESKIEPIVKKYIDRGSVILSLQITEEPSLANLDSIYNIPVLKQYIQAASLVRDQLNDQSLSTGNVSDFLRLPFVLWDNSKNQSEEKLNAVWKLVVQNLEMALSQLQDMRQKEGYQMEINLRDNCQKLEQLIKQVEIFAPQVVQNYRTRLTERITKIMNEQHLTFSPGDLIREIALFTDKADISEEIVRFQSHLKQFYSAISEEKDCGKKLDFLTQEFLREANTIGSKANYIEITNCVVEMKTVIERIREMVQNVA